MEGGWHASWIWRWHSLTTPHLGHTCGVVRRSNVEVGVLVGVALERDKVHQISTRAHTHTRTHCDNTYENGRLRSLIKNIGRGWTRNERLQLCLAPPGLELIFRWSCFCRSDMVFWIGKTCQKTQIYFCHLGPQGNCFYRSMINRRDVGRAPCLSIPITIQWW